MENTEFSRLVEEFKRESTEGKIRLYTSSPGLSMDQYKELLKLYPYNEIDRLEKALAGA